MTNYLFRLYYAKLRYLEFPGSVVIGGFKPGVKIIKYILWANLFSIEIVFNKTSPNINPLYYKDQDNIFMIHAIYVYYNTKNCIHLLFISPVLVYISTWNSVCKLKMIHTIILPKDKFTRLTKPGISRGGGKKAPPLTDGTCKNTVTDEALKGKKCR